MVSGLPPVHMSQGIHQLQGPYLHKRSGNRKVMLPHEKEPIISFIPSLLTSLGGMQLPVVGTLSPEYDERLFQQHSFTVRTVCKHITTNLWVSLLSV